MGMDQQIECSYKKLVALPELVPNPDNPNKHNKKQIDLLAKLINFQGVRHPIIVSERSGFIVAGHARLAAAQKLGLETFPVDYQAFESEAQEYAFMVSDNKIPELAEHDDNMMIDKLREFPDLDLDLTGIPDLTIDEPKPALTDEDSVPDNVETICKPGDLWILGEHRLLCGDATNIQHVERLMDGEKTDIGFTSPPYNANKNAGGLIEKKYARSDDAMNDDDFEELLTSATDLSIQFSRFSFINIQMLSHNKMPLFNWQTKFKNRIKDILIWVKNIAPPQINKGTFNSKWEYVFCFSDESPNSRAFPCKWHGKHFNVIETENASRNEFAKIHRATFPVSFPLWIIEKMDFAKSVLDLFGGSGSTLIACEKTNRKCYMMEIDPHYCDVIINRWQDYTGKKAELHET
jgi:DNA modification methylase